MSKTEKKRITTRSAASARKQAARACTKQSTAINLLRSPAGATIAALTKATGWQPNSVRGFLAGVVRKRLKLDLKSAVVEGARIYRVTGAHMATKLDGRKP